MAKRRRRSQPILSRVSPATLAEVCGAALIGVGLWLVFVPLAFLWAGLACFGLSYTIERRAKQARLAVIVDERGLPVAPLRRVAA